MARSSIVDRVVLLLLALLLLAGCQSREEQAYVDEVNSLSREASSVLDGLDPKGSTEANAEVLEEFEQEVDRFRKLDAPESVAGEHQALVKALEAMLRGLEKINAKAGVGASVEAGIAEVTRSNELLQAAVDDLDRKL